MDCMDLMKEYPDNHFELAICDPNYGIGMDNSNKRTKPSRPKSYTQYKDFRYKKADWDKGRPSKEYFKQLFRASKNQIIFGANYFCDNMPPSKGWLFWNKLNGENNCFSDGEFAFCSKGVQSRYYQCSQFDGLHGGIDRIHPTQKPVKLYKWLLENYAKPGDKILDTHGGSMSSVLACIDMGFSITCCELDCDYFNQSKKRILEHVKQLSLFNEQPEIKFFDSDNHLCDFYPR